jgi:hypothetical protein
MKKIMAFVLLFVTSISMAKVFTNVKEVKNYLKEKKSVSKSDPYTFEMQKAISDFKKAGIASGTVIGVTAVYALLMKGFGLAEHSFMSERIGDLPVVAWTFYALAAFDIMGIGYAGYKSIHGTKHLILAQYKKSLKDERLRYG